MRQPIDTVLLSVYFYIFLLFWTLRSQNVGWILWIWLKLQKLVFCKAYRNRKKMWQQNAPFRKKIILPVSHSTMHRETVPPKMGTVLDQNRELLPSIGLIWGWRVRNNLRLFLTLMMKQFLQIYINWGSLGNHQGNGLHMPCILVWRQTLTTTNMFFSSFASCKRVVLIAHWLAPLLYFAFGVRTQLVTSNYPTHRLFLASKSCTTSSSNDCLLCAQVVGYRCNFYSKFLGEGKKTMTAINLSTPSDMEARIIELNQFRLNNTLTHTSRRRRKSWKLT